MLKLENRYSVMDGDTEIAHGVTMDEVLRILSETRAKDVPGQQARLYFKNLGFAVHGNAVSEGL